MIARYHSTCPTCGRSITPGMNVVWSRGSKARHSTCGGANYATVARRRNDDRDDDYDRARDEWMENGGQGRYIDAVRYRRGY